MAGGALGVLLASWLVALVPALVPALSETSLMLDGRVLLFTAVISLLTALIFGLAPGLRAAKGDLVAVIKGEILDWVRPRTPAAAEFAGIGRDHALGDPAAGSALLLRSFLYSQRINPGFNPKKNVLMLSVAPPTLYGYNLAQATALYPALAARSIHPRGSARQLCPAPSHDEQRRRRNTGGGHSRSAAASRNRPFQDSVQHCGPKVLRYDRGAPCGRAGV